MSYPTRPDAAAHGGAPDGIFFVPDGFDQTYPDAALIAEAITSRLFTAGYDLCFVLGMTSDGPGKTRLEHAVSEVDGAIRDLRHLMLTLWERAPHPPGGSRTSNGN
jgi:hypothetical protein